VSSSSSPTFPWISDKLWKIYEKVSSSSSGEQQQQQRPYISDKLWKN
jgi:hypothetical protein